LEVVMQAARPLMVRFALIQRLHAQEPTHY
jgi:hypothetical protein